MTDRRSIITTLLIAPLGFMKGLFGKQPDQQRYLRQEQMIDKESLKEEYPENPTDILMRQLTTVKTQLIPFWGHGKTEMNLHPQDDGDVEVVYVYRQGNHSYISGFRATKDMAVPGPDNQNLLLIKVADHFREWMLSMPYEIRMHGGPTQYPTDAELAAGVATA
jgi:hypothetical protein